MTWKQWIITIAVFIHLFLVVIFIWTKFPENNPSQLHKTFRSYKNLSGCFRDYTFFAPNVASDLRAGFYVEEDSTSYFINFSGTNKEIAFRYNCIIASCMRDEGGRDLFAQSWAATIFGSNPNAKKVTVVTEAYDVPEMGEFRAGKRPSWEIIYVGEFTR